MKRKEDEVLRKEEKLKSKQKSIQKKEEQLDEREKQIELFEQQVDLMERELDQKIQNQSLSTAVGRRGYEDVEIIDESERSANEHMAELNGYNLKMNSERDSENINCSIVL